MDLEALVKVIAYGVPALLILLGFFGVVIGQSSEAVTGSSYGFTPLGVIMIFFGIVIYLFELLISYNSQRSEW